MEAGNRFTVWGEHHRSAAGLMRDCQQRQSLSLSPIPWRRNSAPTPDADTDYRLLLAEDGESWPYADGLGPPLNFLPRAAHPLVRDGLH
jgi:hypothetical protein